MKIEIEDPRAQEFKDEDLEKLRAKLLRAARLSANISLTQEEATFLLSLLNPPAHQS